MEGRNRHSRRSEPVDIKYNRRSDFASPVQPSSPSLLYVKSSASLILRFLNLLLLSLFSSHFFPTTFRSLVGSLQEPVGSSHVHNSSILEDILRPQNLLKQVAKQSFRKNRKDTPKFASPKFVHKTSRQELSDFVQNRTNAEDVEDGHVKAPYINSISFKLDLTALFVINALGGRSVVLRRTPAALWRYRMIHSNGWRLIFAITSVTNLALALIEEPMYKPQKTDNWLCPTPVSRG